MKQTHQHTHSGSCKEIYRHMCENLDNDPDSEACREMRKHLEGCVNCSAMLDSLKKTVSQYKNYPIPEIPAAARKELFAVIQLAQKKKKSTRKK